VPTRLGAVSDKYERLNQLALSQHSVFLTHQAREFGFSRFDIDQRLEQRTWLRVQRGVLRLPGAPYGDMAKLSAGCLSISGAVVSHESSAFLHSFSGFDVPTRLAVAVDGTSGRSPFVHVHRYRGMDEIDIVTVAGLPATSPALTLFHLSAVLTERRLGRLIDSCLHRNLVEMPELFALSDFWTRVGRPRRKMMRRILLRREHTYIPAESELESAFLELIERHGLTPPVRQFRAPWLETFSGRVDFAYPVAQLLVEVDGRAFHTRDGDFERDRRRDRQATLNGFITLRYTWDEITRRGNMVAAELRAALSRPQEAA